MIAVLFALPEESRDFVALLKDRTPARLPGGLTLLTGLLDGREIALFYLGMGDACVRERLRRAVELGLAAPWKRLILAGFAGGLDPALGVGSLVIDRAGGVALSRAVSGKIITSLHTLETPGQKAEAFRETGALAVEMESRAVGEFAHAHGLPLVQLRAITDPAGEALPVPTEVWFDLEMQKPRPGALLGYLALHPERIPAFARFVRNVGVARQALAAGLAELVRQLP